jgi:hypothetical protein
VFSLSCQNSKGLLADEMKERGVKESGGVKMVHKSEVTFRRIICMQSLFASISIQRRPLQWQKSIKWCRTFNVLPSNLRYDDKTTFLAKKLAREV